MDSGLAGLRPRPGMTRSEALALASSRDAHMQVALTIRGGDAARRDDDALAGKLDDRGTLHAAGWRKGGAVDRGVDRPRRIIEHDAAPAGPAQLFTPSLARRRRQRAVCNRACADDLKAGMGIGRAAAEQRFVFALE